MANSQQLFTVEQVELIRRLRNTGINVSQIAAAFDTLDRIEDELQPYMSQSGNKANSKDDGSLQTSNLQSILDAMKGRLEAAKTDSKLPTLTNGTAPASPMVQPSNGNGTEEGQLSHNTFDGNGNRERDNREALREFLRNGEAAALDEVRKFVAQNAIRQHTIAAMTEVSQPYVSRFLRGETSDISVRLKHIMYNWYLTCKSNPELLAAFHAESMKRPTVKSEEFEFSPRRERFTFKSSQVAILEAHYQQDPYPDQRTRQLIAEQCNSLLTQLRPDGTVLPREIVTTQSIANWFANKRKERKRDEPDSFFTPPVKRGRRPNSSYLSQSFNGYSVPTCFYASGNGNGESMTSTTEAQQAAALNYEMLSSADGEEEEIDQTDPAYGQDEGAKLEETDENNTEYV